MILVVIRELLSKKFAVNLQAVYVLLLNITLSNIILYTMENLLELLLEMPRLFVVDQNYTFLKLLFLLKPLSKKECS